MGKFQAVQVGFCFIHQLLLYLKAALLSLEMANYPNPGLLHSIPSPRQLSLNRIFQLNLGLSLVLKQ